MARPGRKSNPNSKRRQTTREAQGRGDIVQAQPLLRKVDAAEAHARQTSDLVRLRQIAIHRARLADLVDEMIGYQDQLPEAIDKAQKQSITDLLRSHRVGDHQATAAELAVQIEQLRSGLVDANGEIESRANRIEKAGFSRPAAAGRDRSALLRGQIDVFESRYRNMLVDIVSDLGIRAADIEYPIDMLHASGRLVGVGEDYSLGADRCEIGAYFCGLHWRIYGRTPKAQDNGYVTPINPEEVQKLLERAKSLKVSEPMTPAQRDWLDAARYEKMRKALNREAKNKEDLWIESLIIAVCCHREQPKLVELPALRDGLSRLLDARLPGRDNVPDILAEEMVA